MDAKTQMANKIISILQDIANVQVSEEDFEPLPEEVFDDITALSKKLLTWSGAVGPKQKGPQK